MAKKTLKEVFGLREMSVNVPDKDAPALQKIIDIAIQHGQLPPDAAHWMAVSKAQTSSTPQTSGEPKTPRGAKGTPSPTPSGKPSADPQSAWDALAGSKPAPAAKAKSATKAKPVAQKPVDPQASWAAPKSANVQLGPEPEGDAAPYKSPFAWDKIDPAGARGTDMDVPDLEPGNYRTLPQQQQKSHGFASRVAGGIKNAFKGKPSDGRRELDKALKAADRQANSKQGALSKIFKGKDVTRGQGS